MTDADRLERTLAKLAAAAGSPAPGGRWIATEGSGPDAMLAAVLTEVDETMLARRLVFAPEPGVSFGLDVYGRRLLMVAPGVPEGLPHAGMAGRVLDAQVPGEWERLAELLRALLEGAERLSVRSEPPHGRHDPSALGYAATTLAEALGLELGGVQRAPIAPLDRMANRCGGEAIAWMRLRGASKLSERGDPRLLALLRGFVRPGLDGLRELEASADPEPKCVVLGPADGGAAQLVIAEAGDESVVMLLPASALPALMAAWHSTFR